MKFLAIHTRPEELAILKDFVAQGAEVYTLFDGKPFKITFDSETATHSRLPIEFENIKEFESFFMIPVTTLADNQFDEIIKRVDNIEEYLTTPTFKRR